MLSKSSKRELGFVHYLKKFTISRFVISRFECIYFFYTDCYSKNPHYRPLSYYAEIQRCCNDNVKKIIVAPFCN